MPVDVSTVTSEPEKAPTASAVGVPDVVVMSGRQEDLAPSDDVCGVAAAQSPPQSPDIVSRGERRPLNISLRQRPVRPEAEALSPPPTVASTTPPRTAADPVLKSPDSEGDSARKRLSIRGVRHDTSWINKGGEASASGSNVTALKSAPTPETEPMGEPVDVVVVMVDSSPVWPAPSMLSEEVELGGDAAETSVLVPDDVQSALLTTFTSDAYRDEEDEEEEEEALNNMDMLIGDLKPLGQRRS